MKLGLRREEVVEAEECSRDIKALDKPCCEPTQREKVALGDCVEHRNLKYGDERRIVFFYRYTHLVKCINLHS